MPARPAGITARPDAASVAGSTGPTAVQSVPPFGATSDSIVTLPMGWDAYGMAQAQLASVRSKDPSLKVGAAILDRKNRVVSSGYNGFPRGVPDDADLLSVREVKYDLVIHAEVNAILFAQRDLDGCTIYVWPAPPCSRCASVIAQSGIKRVVAQTPTADYLDRWGKSCELAEWVYQQAGIEYVEMSL